MHERRDKCEIFLSTASSMREAVFYTVPVERKKDKQEANSMNKMKAMLLFLLCAAAVRAYSLQAQTNEATAKTIL